MLNLDMFCHNYHPSDVKMVANFIRLGFSLVNTGHWIDDFPE